MVAVSRVEETRDLQPNSGDLPGRQRASRGHKLTQCRAHRGVRHEIERTVFGRSVLPDPKQPRRLQLAESLHVSVEDRGRLGSLISGQPR